MTDPIVDEVRRARDAIQKLEPLVGILPNDMGVDYKRIPETISAIQGWVKGNATDEEGNITILNIQNLVAYNNGREIAIRNSNLWGDPVVVDTYTKGGFTALFP